MMLEDFRQGWKPVPETGWTFLWMPERAAPRRPLELCQTTIRPSRSPGVHPAGSVPHPWVSSVVWSWEQTEAEVVWWTLKAWEARDQLFQQCSAGVCSCVGLVLRPFRSSLTSVVIQGFWFGFGVSSQRQSQFRTPCIPSLPVWTLSGPGFQSPAAWWYWQVRLCCFLEVCVQGLGAERSGLTGLNGAAAWLCMHV